MTRAQNDLLLMSPLKFHLTNQHRAGDAHVYGGRSRFLTEKVTKCFEPRTFQGSAMGDTALQASAESTLDVGARLKEMW
jgi:DNA helicase-2/ATP-dependent DNA helicase PcrA